MALKTETMSVEESSVEEVVEATLRDVRAFLDDPVALLERAAELMRRGATRSAPAGEL
jgi:hypothetical protein